MKSNPFKQIAALLLVMMLIIPSALFSATAASVSDDSDFPILSFDAEMLTPAPSQSFSNSLDSKLVATIESGILQLDESIDISAYGIKLDEIQAVYSAFFYTNPQLFWVQKRCGARYNTTTSVISSIQPTYSVGAIQDLNARRIPFSNKVGQMLSTIPENASTVEQVLAINDYIVLNTEYDANQEKGSAYNTLVEGSANAQGYALTVALFCNYLGIENKMVSSEEMDHIWNIVKVNGSWYHWDATANDYVDVKEKKYKRSQEADIMGYVGHDYLLISDTEIKKTHSDWDDSKIKSASTAFDKYFWRNVKASFYAYDGEWYYLAPGNTYLSYYTLSVYSFATSVSGAILEPEKLWITSRLLRYGDTLYFNTDDTILSFDLVTGEIADEPFHTEPNLSALAGQIIGEATIRSEEGIDWIYFRLTNDLANTYYVTKRLLLGQTPAPETASIVFSSNGGFGTMESVTIPLNVEYTLPANTFTRGGFAFAGWATSPDGSVVYQDCDTIKITEGIALYAVWTGSVLVMRLNSPIAILDSKSIAVDPVTPTVYPFTYNTRTVVPVRFIENLGANVKYNGVDEPVVITLGDATIQLVFGEKEYKLTKNGETTKKTFESAPSLIEGKTCVPFRAIAEDLGFSVKYDEKSYVIMVSTDELSDAEQKTMIEIGKTINTSVKAVSSISAKQSSRTIAVGQSFEIKSDDIVFEPSDAPVKILIYSCSNTKVVTVTSKGKVKGVGKGTAKVTVYSHNGKSTTVTVTVS